MGIFILVVPHAYSLSDYSSPLAILLINDCDWIMELKQIIA